MPRVTRVIIKLNISLSLNLLIKVLKKPSFEPRTVFLAASLAEPNISSNIVLLFKLLNYFYFTAAKHVACFLQTAYFEFSFILEFYIIKMNIIPSRLYREGECINNFTRSNICDININRRFAYRIFQFDHNGNFTRFEF